MQDVTLHWANYALRLWLHPDIDGVDFWEATISLQSGREFLFGTRIRNRCPGDAIEELIDRAIQEGYLTLLESIAESYPCP